MPDTGAPWNIPYVENADLVRDWPADSLLVANAVAAGLSAAGGLVDVKFVAKTDTFSASVAAGANAAITGLSISHAVADAANTVYLVATMNGAQSDLDRVNFALAAGGTLLDVGATAGNRTSVGGSNSGSTTQQGSSVTLLAKYVPGTTSSVTYDGRVVCVRGDTTTLYVNRSQSDADFVYVSREASTLMLLEVKV